MNPGLIYAPLGVCTDISRPLWCVNLRSVKILTKSRHIHKSDDGPSLRRVVVSLPTPLLSNCAMGTELHSHVVSILHSSLASKQRIVGYVVTMGALQYRASRLQYTAKVVAQSNSAIGMYEYH